jgi:uncharacterized membrane protein
MQIYWSNKDIPELANLTAEQQKQAWQACYKKYALRSPSAYVGMGIIVVLVIIGINLFGPIVGGAIGGGIGGGIFGILVQNALRPHLKAYVEQNFPSV